MRYWQKIPFYFSTRVTSSKSNTIWSTPLLFKCFGTFRGHHGLVNCLTVWNNKLISGGSDNVLKLWDLENLAKGCLLTVGGHVDAVSIVLFWLCIIPCTLFLSSLAQSFSWVKSVYNISKQVVILPLVMCRGKVCWAIARAVEPSVPELIPVSIALSA